MKVAEYVGPPQPQPGVAEDALGRAPPRQHLVTTLTPGFCPFRERAPRDRVFGGEEQLHEEGGRMTIASAWQAPNSGIRGAPDRSTHTRSRSVGTVSTTRIRACVEHPAVGVWSGRLERPLRDRAERHHRHSYSVTVDVGGSQAPPSHNALGAFLAIQPRRTRRPWIWQPRHRPRADSIHISVRQIRHIVPAGSPGCRCS